ncbi:MAG: leucine-rich repeat domain-containing protein [Lachnospiraceae bacterium]|nr:leucine-rich repeat domain-containing protein [Lachnospiraceae bacterium]
MNKKYNSTESNTFNNKTRQVKGEFSHKRTPLFRCLVLVVATLVIMADLGRGSSFGKGSDNRAKVNAAETQESVRPSTEPGESVVPSTTPGESARPSTEPEESAEPSEEPEESVSPSEEPVESTEPSEEPGESAEPSVEPSISPTPTPKLIPKYTVPKDKSVTYRPGLQVGDLTLPKGWTWKKPTVYLNVGETTCAILFTPEDTERYLTVSKKIKVKVKVRSASHFTIKMSKKTYAYTGKAIKPIVYVKDGSAMLTNGVNYTVSYSNNIKRGSKTAKVTVKGIGNYKGTKTAKFSIGVVKGYEKTINGIRYRVTDTSSKNRRVKCISVTNKKARKIKVPDTVKIFGKKYKVTAVGEDAFYYCKKATTVKLGKNITSLAEGSFHSCSALKSVAITGRITSIGTEAFKNCSRLTKVTIGRRVESIGARAFENCRNLKLVVITSKRIGNFGADSFKNTHKEIKFRITKSKKKVYMESLYKVGVPEEKKDEENKKENE